MATLVHDDVLDEAEVRRRGVTVNTLYGNEPAVILGDYLFAAAYHLCSQIEDSALAQRAAQQVGRASMATCAGELMQLHHRKNFALTEAEYFEIVAGKTGELIATSCALGALISRATPQRADALSRFGRTLGIAFQIQDDVLDLVGSEATVGKSIHSDLALGKMTLPVIHHLAQAPGLERAASLALVQAAADGQAGASESLKAAIARTSSIEYASASARNLVREAIACLEDAAAVQVWHRHDDQRA